MTRTRALVAVGAATAAILVILLGGAFRGSPSAGSTPNEGGARAGSVDRAVTGFAPTTSGAAASVSRLEQAVAADPTDAKSLALLGLAYGQRWRETGDPSFVSLQARALRRARTLKPRDPLTLQGLGSLALTQHEFRHALAVGREAVRVAPYTANTYGIVGDALLELGRYPEAFGAFQRMVDLKPSLASYARASYARELSGDLPGAIAAMRLALDAAAGDREGYAWTAVQLGKLHWQRGEGKVAERLYRSALEVFPGYVYAYDALAPVEAARGRLTAAISLERRAVESIPLPQFVAQLGDLLERAGRPKEARAQFGTVRAIERLLVANGIKTDLETALFRADHAIAPAQTVALARRARADRPSILGDDALAWSLARAGRCEEALSWSQQSLELGTRDPLLFFHRGAIERCLGHTASAQSWFQKALALNPHFSIRWAPVAASWSRS
jgi:tetratricopeptide (TPR) repeat protein